MRAKIVATYFVMIACVWSATTAVHGQTTVNINTTNIVVKNQQNIIVTRPSSMSRAAPVAQTTPPPTFPYQPRELLPYMSSRCAQLYETQLASYARRTSASVAAGVRDEFQSNCPDAVADARRSLFQNKLGKYNAAQDQKLAATMSTENDRATKEQCSELLRILAGKRKQLESMTDGEKADHARFEVNYAARCKRD